MLCNPYGKGVGEEMGGPGPSYIDLVLPKEKLEPYLEFQVVGYRTRETRETHPKNGLAPPPANQTAVRDRPSTCWGPGPLRSKCLMACTVPKWTSEMHTSRLTESPRSHRRQGSVHSLTGRGGFETAKRKTHLSWLALEGEQKLSDLSS